jgi:perosamine synthetase
VIVVHQAGTPADVAAIHALCDPRGIVVIEDAACAVGSTYLGHRVGANAELAAFSFHPRKLVTTGEGGMLAVKDPALGARLRRLREHGMDVSAATRHAAGRPVIERYVETGFNFRMTDVQAAMGLVQLSRLDAMIERRRALADRYTRLLDDLPVTVAADPPWGTTNFQSFWVLLDDDFGASRERVMEAMADAGISVRRGIMAAHLEPAYADVALRVPLPATEHVTRESVILPLFHDMTTAEQDRVVDTMVAVHDRRLVRTP